MKPNDPSAELMNLAKRLDEATFAKKHPGFFLIVRGTGDGPAEESIRSTVRVERSGTTPPPETRAFKIIPVVRRGMTPFSDVVSLGRVESNDIVIPHTTISKLHACFSEGEDGVWTLTDQGSTNGTFVAGTRLVAKEPRTLGQNEMLAFGECHVALKGASALWRFLSLDRRSA